MLSLTVDALRGGFWGFSALVSGVSTCTFYAPEIMVAVFLCVCNLASFALYYLFLYKRWFMSMKYSDSGFSMILYLMLLMLVTSWPCFNSSNISSSRSAEWWMLRSTTRNGLSCLSW